MSVSRKYPDLNGRYQIASPNDRRYNSIAWAMNDEHQYWDPHPFTGGYWPDDLPCNGELTLEILIQLFQLYGYECTNSGNFEPGYQRIAIYTTYGKPSHVARQEQSGKWTSKIYRCERIRHQTPYHIESNESRFGLGVLSNIFLRRSIHN